MELGSILIGNQKIKYLGLGQMRKIYESAEAALEGIAKPIP